MHPDQEPTEEELLAQQEDMMVFKDTLENKTEEECREDFLQVMECHD
jgi:hypothetical protein